MLDKSARLENKKIAILATDGFEESELFSPKEALESAGAKVDIISLKEGKIKAWHETNWGREIKVDFAVKNADPQIYDALMIPGGVMNPDKLRMDRNAIDFVKQFANEGKSIASICHGPQVLIEAGLTKGKYLTSWPSLKTDLLNSGAMWTDEEVVSDNCLITSRSPKDLPAFNKKMIEEFAANHH